MSIVFRKIFLYLATNVIWVLLIALAFALLFGGVYFIKSNQDAKEQLVVYNSINESYEANLKAYNEEINSLPGKIEELSIEKNKLLNEIGYKSKARESITYSITDSNLKKDDLSANLFFQSVNNTINNETIANKLSLVNRANDVFSISISNALSSDNTVLLTAYISAVDNETVDELSTSIDNLIAESFPTYDIAVKDTSVSILDQDDVKSLKEQEKELSDDLAELNEKLNQLIQNPVIKPVEPLVESFVKDAIIRGVLGFIFGCCCIGLYALLKNSFTPYVNDIAFASDCLSIQTLAIIDSEHYKKNFLTKLFMRKPPYSNKDAYGIVSVYLKENLSVLSFLDAAKEKEFKAAVGAEVVNCNGDLSSLFEAIAQKNNFVILLDTETSRTRQVVEVYNFIKNLNLDIYGAVVYTC